MAAVDSTIEEIEKPSADQTTEQPSNQQTEQNTDDVIDENNEKSGAKVTSFQLPPEDTVQPGQPVELSSFGETAKRVQFFRNGDRYFKGSVWGVSPQKFCSFESKLVELVNVPFKENPADVATKYTLDKARVLNALENLSDSASHFLATKDLFSQLATESGSDEPAAIKLTAAATKLSLVSRDRDREMTKLALENEPPADPTASSPFATNTGLPNEATPFPAQSRTVVVIRNGCKPRRIVRFLLNHQTAHSYEQVLADMGDAVRSEVGTIKKVYGIDGVQVHSLSDFFKEEVSTYIVFGPENPSPSDFELDAVERKWVSFKPRQIFHISAVAVAKKLLNIFRAKGRQISETNERPDTTDRRSDYDGSTGRELSEFPPPDLEKQQVVSGFWLSYRLGEICFQSHLSTTHFCTSISTTASSDLLAKVLETAKSPGTFDREMTLLPQLNHSNLVHACDQIFNAPDVSFVVFPSISGFRLIDSVTEGTQYSEVKIISTLQQLLEAVVYLHQDKKVVHFNINHKAIMFNDEGKLLLGSFAKTASIEEVSRARTAESRRTFENSVSNFTAPEIFDISQDLTAKCDIYSVAVLLLTLLTGQLELTQYVTANSLEKLFRENSYSNAMQNLVIQLFGLKPGAESPRNRITANEALLFITSSGDQWSDVILDSKVTDGLLQIASGGASNVTKKRITNASIVFDNE